jgi:polysaccharide deacetylase family protein (PEP-CTERM system associated)
VEDYFHIEAAHDTITPPQWNDWPSRVERNVDALLALLAHHHRRATFFVLGDVAQRHPHLAQRIALAGHEVASHGTNHQRLHRLTPTTFRDDLLTSQHLLEDQTGRRVLGYRAPTFSLVPQTAWALDTLIDAGFQYDSSIFPVRHPLYGVPAAPRRPYYASNRPNGPGILEVPPLVWEPLPGSKLPVAGGGYFRLLPLWFMQRGLSQAAAQNHPAVLYFHPWEFDPDMPRLPLRLTARWRTYTGLRTAAARLQRILRQPARWSPIASVLDELRTMAAERPPYNLAA